MKPFDNLPIQRKLLANTILICGVVLPVSILALVVFQSLSFRTGFKRDFATLAAILADNSTAALAFNDATTAREILNSLHAKPSIRYAALVTPGGQIIAEFGKLREPVSPRGFPPAKEFRFSGADLFYSQPVTLEGKDIGSLYMCADFGSLQWRLLGFFGLVITGIVVVSLVLALLLSARLGRSVSEPVLALAQTARQIGSRHDYSVRASVGDRDDELGLLAAAFNQMLDRIQNQDAALSLSQQKLEALVNSINGIVWERSVSGLGFTYVSLQSQALLGWGPEKWLEDPNFWQEHLYAEDAELAVRTTQEALHQRQSYQHDYRMVAADGRVVWIRESAVVLSRQDQPVAIRGIFQDITHQKKAEQALAQLNRKLVDISRQAGMAEVATGVLHNVGNVLNSLNVSASLILSKLTHSETANLIKAADLLEQHADDLITFLTTDPKGQQLAGFIVRQARRIQREQEMLQKEQRVVARNVEHIMQIVAMQQNYARVSGVIEKVQVASLLEDALEMNQAELQSQQVKIERRYLQSPHALLDRHKFLQILVNLLRNARQALVQSGRPDKVLTLGLEMDGAEQVKVTVTDNGIGIPRENLARIFSLGFTTGLGGHGFGLHNAANAAREMGGSLRASSEGPNQGATFTLELPAAPLSSPPQPAPDRPQSPAASPSERDAAGG